jgi:AraC-like DNA-binding protein
LNEAATKIRPAKPRVIFPVGAPSTAPVLITPLVTEMVSLDYVLHRGAPGQWREHLHCFCQFDLTFSGELYHLLDRGTLRSRRADAVFIPPLVRHGHRTKSGFRTAMFKFHVAPRYWRLLGESAFQVKLSRLALDAADAAVEARKQASPLPGQKAAAALTLCLIEALERRKQGGAGGPDSSGTRELRAQLWPLLERVESAPFAGWTVAGLGKACSLSPDYFGRMFTRALGQSPHEYLARVRLRAAAQELAANAQTSIKRVAQDSGYATVHAFSRAFRRVIGVTPAAFRNSASAEM